MSKPSCLVLHDVGGRAVITYKVRGQYVTVANELAQYTRWASSFKSDGKHRPSEAFFQAKGEYICRALNSLRPSALNVTGAFMTNDDGRRVTWMAVIGDEFRNMSATLDAKMINVKIYLDGYEEVTFRLGIKDEDEYAKLMRPKPKPAEASCGYCHKNDCSGGCTQ